MTVPAYVTRPHPWFEPGPFAICTSFSSAMILGNFISNRDGQGGKWLDWERRWMARCKSSGFVGLRRPCESTYWDDRDDNPNNDHKFFNASRASSLATWNYNALRTGTRPGADPRAPALTIHMQKYLLWTIILCREFEMKQELIPDFTLKHSPGVGWDVIGHCIRQTLAFLDLVHRSDWNKGPSGNEIGHPTNQQADEKIRALFERAKGPIDRIVSVDLHNEWDAHSRGAWAVNGYDRNGARRELHRQLERASKSQWPAGCVYVSNGGNDNPDTSVQFASARAIHAERPETNVGARFDHLKTDGVPIIVNEMIHHIDPSRWAATIGAGWFGVNSSSKDTADVIRFQDEMQAKGLWWCHHGLTFMENGLRWKGTGLSFDDYEPVPLDDYELARGASIVDPVPVPDPDPDPDPGPDPEPDPDAGLSKLFITPPDVNGVRSVRVEWPELWPRVVHGVTPEDAVTEVHDIDLPSPMTFASANTFIGLDRGDVGEYAVTVAARSGPEIYGRSLHKEMAAPFESEPAPVPVPLVTTDKLRVWIVARTTGANDVLRRGQPWSSRPDYVLKLWTLGKLGPMVAGVSAVPTSPPEPVVPPASVQPPVDEPDPPASTKPQRYIPWDDREAWAAKVDNAYHVHRGERDIENALAFPQFFFGGTDAILDIDTRTARVLVSVMTDWHEKQARLAWRIRNERHREHSGRSQVRKDVANAMVEDLEEITAKWTALSDQVPQVKGCDAIECRLEKLADGTAEILHDPREDG